MKKSPLQQTTLNIRQMREELSNPNSPGKLAMRIYLAKKHAITLEELTAARFQAHTSELTHDLWRKSIADFNREIPTEIWRLAQSPRLAHLFLAVCQIRYKQLPSTAKCLAQILGISRASLYRKYKSEQIQETLAAIG